MGTLLRRVNWRPILILGALLASSCDRQETGTATAPSPTSKTATAPTQADPGSKRTISVQGPPWRVRPNPKADYLPGLGIGKHTLVGLESEQTHRGRGAPGLSAEQFAAFRYYYLPLFLLAKENGDLGVTVSSSGTVTIPLIVDAPGLVRFQFKRALEGGKFVKYPVDKEQIQLAPLRRVLVSVESADGTPICVTEIKQVTFTTSTFDLRLNVGTARAAEVKRAFEAGELDLKFTCEFEGYSYTEDSVKLTFADLESSKLFQEINTHQADKPLLSKKQVGDLIADASRHLEVVIDRETNDPAFESYISFVMSQLGDQSAQLDSLKAKHIAAASRYTVDPNELKADILSSFASKIDRHSEAYRKLKEYTKSVFDQKTEGNAGFSVVDVVSADASGSLESHKNDIRDTLIEVFDKWGIKCEVDKTGMIFVPSKVLLATSQVQKLSTIGQAPVVLRRQHSAGEGTLTIIVNAKRNVIVDFEKKQLKALEKIRYIETEYPQRKLQRDQIVERNNDRAKKLAELIKKWETAPPTIGPVGGYDIVNDPKKAWNSMGDRGFGRHVRAVGIMYTSSGDPQRDQGQVDAIALKFDDDKENATPTWHGNAKVGGAMVAWYEIDVKKGERFSGIVCDHNHFSIRKLVIMNSSGAISQQFGSISPHNDANDRTDVTCFSLKEEVTGGAVKFGHFLDAVKFTLRPLNGPGIKTEWDPEDVPELTDPVYADE